MCAKFYQNRRGQEHFGLFLVDFIWNDPDVRMQSPELADAIII